MGNSTSRKRAAGQRHEAIRRKSAGFEPGADPPCFVADVMLGRLAKWLRIAGFDVLYSNRYSDDELVFLSRTGGRILLSRDTRLLVRRVVRRFVYLESERIEDQVLQIFRSTRTTSLPNILNRCLRCNDLIGMVPRESVRELVPPFVYETQHQFKGCPRCRKIYWPGTHRQSVVRTLHRILEMTPPPEP